MSDNRKKYRHMIHKIIKKYVSDNELSIVPKKAKRTSKKIEKSIYTFAGGNEQIYDEKAISILRNLDQKSAINNGYLIRMIFDPSFDLLKIAFLSSAEIFPENWDKIIAERNAQIDALKNKKGYVSDKFTCPKCHQRKCTYFMKQTRSCDEGSTIFVKCLACGKHFKCGG